MLLRIQGVSAATRAWRWVIASYNLYLIPRLQLVIQWSNPTVYFRTDAAVSNLGVDAIAKSTGLSLAAYQ